MKRAELFRVPLVRYTTPLEEARRLREYIGRHACPRLLLKRDDLIGFGFGGTKVRKLEYILGRALNERSTMLLTAGWLQSNHARLVAAAATHLGMRCILVLGAHGNVEPEKVADMNGNVRLAKLLGAEVRVVRPAAEDPMGAEQELQAELLSIAKVATRSGERPFIVPIAGASLEGIYGARRGADELSQQLRSSGAAAASVYLATGSASTYAGFRAATHSGSDSWQVKPIAAIPPLPEQLKRLAVSMQQMGVDSPIDESVFDRRFLGSAYESPPAEAHAAVQLLARTEGVFCEPVYTGRAVAALIHDIRAQKYDNQSTLVLIHTGGNPTLFA